jgi:hypothetical protein
MRSETHYTGLDYNALIGMAPGMNIAADQTFFENLHIFERAGLRHLNGVAEADKTCNETRKKACTLEFGEEWMDWACKNCKKGKIPGHN